jgi:hypothetical protein
MEAKGCVEDMVKMRELHLQPEARPANRYSAWSHVRIAYCYARTPGRFMLAIVLRFFNAAFPLRGTYTLKNYSNFLLRCTVEG